MVNHCCIHQPEHLPYIGFFAKLMHANTWIVFDTAQYQKGHFHNRNRIALGQAAWQWLTVPVMVAHHRSPFNIARVADEFKPSKYLSSVKHAYSGAPCFNAIISILESAAGRATKHKQLLDFNLELVLDIMAYLAIRASIVLASSIEKKPSTNKTERLLALCKGISSRSYLCGSGSSAYLDLPMFTDAGIGVGQLSYTPEPYARKGGYVPYLSIIDVLMYNPPVEAREIILSSVSLLYHPALPQNEFYGKGHTHTM